MRTDKHTRKGYEASAAAVGLDYVLGYSAPAGAQPTAAASTQPDPPRGSRTSWLGEQMSENRRTGIAMAITLFVVISVFSLGFLTGDGGGIAGFSVKETSDAMGGLTSATAYTEKAIPLDNVTSVRLSGHVTGLGARFWLKTEEGNLSIGEVDAGGSTKVYTLTTDKREYAPGEGVQIITSPADTSTTTYVHFGEQTSIVSDSYTPSAPGEYEAVRLITTGEDIVRLGVNFTVLAEGEGGGAPESASYTAQTPILFEDLCGETCNMSAAYRPVLVIDPWAESEVTISEISMTRLTENQPPVQAAGIGPIELTVGEELEVDLDAYFTDPDDGTLHYDISNLENVSALTQGSKLYLLATDNTTEKARIYATDGEYMAMSDEFTITTLQDEIQLQSGLAGQTNQSPEKLVSAPADPCEAPPKSRPSYCFEGQEDRFLKDIAAPLQDRKGETVGRITRFGNLVIRGWLVEAAGGEPGPDDFRIGQRVMQDYEEVMDYTAWIDGETGHLHLRGELHEEQADLSPPQYGTYIVSNDLGVTLAYFDKTTGDLYLRGNLVQLGKV